MFDMDKNMAAFTVTLWILGFLSFAGGVLPIISWVKIRRKYKKTPLNPYFPRVSIIVPCKGAGKKFKENIRAICNQNYKDYEVIFVTDSSSDSAYKAIQEAVGKDPRVKLVLSDRVEGCSGKVSALLKGVKIADDADVYVFADSDIRPHKEWIRHLVAPLNIEKIGATTGYRWYFIHSLRSLLLSSWNACTAASLFIDKFNFVWGGSTAIRKELFDRLDIKNKWKKSFSDDLILSRIVKENDYSIQFVPESMVECYEEKNLYEIINWGTTQNVWIKWYYPKLWRISFLYAAVFKFLNILGIIVLIDGFAIPGLLMLSPVFLDIIKGWQQFVTFRELMLYPKERFGSAFAYAIISPIASFLLAYNLVTSFFKREIEWKGNVYRFG